MKKITILLVCSALMGTLAAQITFQKTYDGKGHAWPSFVQPIKDSGYIIACGLQKLGTVDDDFYLVRTDNSGNMIWGKTFGGLNSDNAWSVDQTCDGGFIVCGSTFSFGQYLDVYLVKTDSSGRLLWSKVFGVEDPDRGWAVTATSDGGFVITGDSQRNNWGTFIVKVDAAGNILWTKHFGSYESGFSVRQTIDGGFIIGGQTNTGLNGYDCTLIKTDGNGNLMWAHSYGGPYSDNGSWVRQTRDGGYIIAGNTESFGAGRSDAYLVKTDSKGNLLWSKAYGGSQYDDCSSVLETDDGFIMLCETFSYGQNLILVIKTDSIGNPIWSKTYGPGINGSIEKTSDGGYIISATDKYIYLIKTDRNGSSGCNETNVIITSTSCATDVGSPAAIVSTVSFTSLTPVTLTGDGGLDSTLCYHYVPMPGNPSQQTKNQLSVFPNPLSSFATISFSLSQPAKVSLRIYDAIGRLIKILVNGPCPQRNNTIIWNVDLVSTGTYFLVMQTESSVTTKKLVVLR